MRSTVKVRAERFQFDASCSICVVYSSFYFLGCDPDVS